MDRAGRNSTANGVLTAPHELLKRSIGGRTIAVLKLKTHRGRTNEKNLYATPEDFERILTKQNTYLSRLSLHLTSPDVDQWDGAASGDTRAACAGSA
jgi:hypothetical protein